MSTVTTIVLEANPIKPNDSHQTYQVWLGAEQLISRAKNPEFEACRILLARGMGDHQICVRWHKSPHAAMTIGLAWGATKTVAGGDRGGLRIATWQARDTSALERVKS